MGLVRTSMMGGSAYHPKLCHRFQRRSRAQFLPGQREDLQGLSTNHSTIEQVSIGYRGVYVAMPK